MMGVLISSIWITIILALAIVMVWPFFLFGIRLQIAKMKYKGNTGLLMIRSKSNNFSLPRPIDISEDYVEFKKNGVPRPYVFNREQLAGTRYLNLPFNIVDEDDTKTNIGIYYQQCDEAGEPAHYTIRDSHGKQERIPVLKAYKPSLTLRPALFGALHAEKALTIAVMELFQKHKTQLYVLGGIAALLAASVYFTYETYATLLPEILETVKQCVPPGAEVVTGG